MTKNKEKTTLWVIGIDEVGRGPLAGPVTVCAFAVRADIEKGFLHQLHDLSKSADLRDSKGLSEKNREKWNTLLRNFKKEKPDQIFFSIKSKSAQHIDRLGIAVCIKNLVNECLAEILLETKTTHQDCSVLLDGGLKAAPEFIFQKTYIKGDALFPVISFASILAKVHRDRYMTLQAQKYPKYLLEVHKGYGTAKHREVIRKHGLSDFHRKSFCGNILKLPSDQAKGLKR